MARRPYVYACGVDKESCMGAHTATSHGIGGTNNVIKAHSSPEEAFSCMRKYLVAQGWTQISSREFSPPGGGPIRVLTKQSRYGARLRNGKEGTRNMPNERWGGYIVG